MNIRVLTGLAAILISGTAVAQQVKIATVDMALLLNSYYRTADANDKIRSSQETAQQEVQRMTGRGQELVREYQELQERASNPALTDTARATAEASVQAKENEIREKEQELRNFVQTAQRQLQERIVQHRRVLLDEIKQVAIQRAQARGCNLVLDISSLGGDSIASVVYADPSWNITDEVLRELNRNAPPGFVPPAPGALEP